MQTDKELFYEYYGYYKAMSHNHQEAAFMSFLNRVYSECYELSDYVDKIRKECFTEDHELKDHVNCDQVVEQIRNKMENDSMDKAEILYDLLKIKECDGTKMGKWCDDDYINEIITDRYEENMLDMAKKYKIEIPPIEDYTGYDEEYRSREERATDIFWELEKMLMDLLVRL